MQHDHNIYIFQGPNFFGIGEANRHHSHSGFVSIEDQFLHLLITQQCEHGFQRSERHLLFPFCSVVTLKDLRAFSLNSVTKLFPCVHF